MKAPTAVYKKVNGKIDCKTIDSDQMEQAMADGWVDSPATLGDKKPAKKVAAKKVNDGVV